MADDDVLLKLGLESIDSAEADRVAASLQDQLGRASKATYDHLTRLHAQAKKAQTDAEVEAINAQIAELERYGTTVQQVSEHSEHHWQTSLATMRDVAIVGKAAFEALGSLWEGFKHNAEEMIRLTHISESVHGGIDGLRVATRGLVTDTDLMMVKNRAFQKDLALTDDEWSNLAKRANEFGDATGVGMTEALEKLVDGLATGKLKALQFAGVMVDADEAEKNYAKSIGTTAEKLTDAEKLTAKQEAALQKMADKAKESGDEQETAATAAERAIVNATNAWDNFLKMLGHSKALEQAIKLLGDMLEAANKLVEHGLWDLIGQTRRMELEQAADFDAAQKRGKANAALINRGGAPAVPTELINFDEEDDKVKGGGRDKKKKGHESGPVAIATEKYSDMLRKQVLGMIGGENFELGAGSLEASLKKKDEEDEIAQKLADDIEEIAEKVKEKHDKALKHEKAQRGMLETLIFGTDSQQLYSELDYATQRSVDTMNTIGEAGSAMADGLGQEMAAAIAGDDRSGFLSMAKNVLKGLEAQLIGNAISETAMGVAATFLGLVGGATAPQHFGAAAAFAGGATAIAGPLAIIGAATHGGSGGDGTASSAPKQRNAQSNFGGAPSGPGSPKSQQSLPPVNIILWPGTQADGGRIISQMQEAWSRQSGYTFPTSMVRP